MSFGVETKKPAGVLRAHPEVMAQLGGGQRKCSLISFFGTAAAAERKTVCFQLPGDFYCCLYMILSISTQDVMLFLQKMESDAVDKLLLLIPAFYGMTLGILFFLIYFACKYQFERRRHEFGVYLMLGMRRSKLFGMLLAEDFLTSILAMLIGLPVAVVLSEIVSLVTAKLVGMGIIGHQFSLSWSAIEWTLAGFLAIKLSALLILSRRISRQEIGTCYPSQRTAPKSKCHLLSMDWLLYAEV